MAEPNTPKNVRTTNWVGFPKKQAILKRLLDDKGNPGLILRVADNDDGAIVAEMARKNGFQERSIANVFTMIFERDKPIPVKVSQVAELLGGELIQLPFDKIRSNDMLVNLYQRVPRGENPASTEIKQPVQPIQPDPDSMETIGLNLNGEEVVRDRRDRFFRRIIEQDGTHRYIHESEGGQPALFLRACRAEDMAGIAAGILRMAQRGTLHQAQFERILDAALEEGPDGRLDMQRDQAFSVLREQILRQITDVAIEKNNERPSFFRALRLAANIKFIDRPTETMEQLRPGAAMLSLFRRLSHGHDQVDFNGSNDLQVAMPHISSSEASLQVQDFSGVSANGMIEYATNVLSRRPAQGHSVFILPSDVSKQDFERLRSQIGLSYGLEAVAEVNSSIADGIRDGRVFNILFIGERRPEILDSLPRAALRSLTVTTNDDLATLEGEIIRSRGQLHAFNQGEISSEPEAGDSRDENIRQRPYKPLSAIGEPFTMIPRALEGATSKALDRVARHSESNGGIDAVVARALGRSVGDIGEILIPEQIDAIGLRMNAAERGRGFLEADQTGIGKGRTMAALMRIHLRENPANRCLYVTESANINVPDVLRDIKAVDGMKEVNVIILTSGSEFIDITIDQETGEEIHREIKSVKPGERRKIYESESWPENCNLIITTYSQFSVKEEAPQARWLSSIANDNTLIVLDEAHNALNPKSNTGRNFRRARDNMVAQNMIYATGTPARNPGGMDLYESLLPQDEHTEIKNILDNIASGGEVAQEAFATMLAEDGVMIRRDHDLSATEYQVHLPEDDRMLDYQNTMNWFSPIVENMIDVSISIGEIVGRAQALEFRRMVNNGMDERQARSKTNELSQYSMGIGGPLATLARITINAIKVEQVVETAIAEMDQGRKPLITFHSTNAGLLKELSKHEDGSSLSEEELAALPEMTLREQIKRIHNRLYRMKLDGEVMDPRENNSDVMRAFRDFSTSAHGRNFNPVKMILGADRLKQVLKRMETPEALEILNVFEQIQAQIIPDGKISTMLRALVKLNNESFHLNDNSQRANAAFKKAVAKLPKKSLNQEQKDMLDLAIDKFENAGVTEVSDRNTAFEDMKSIIGHIEMPQMTTPELIKEMDTLFARIDALQVDRSQFDDIKAAFTRIEAMIDDIPDLPVSPVDALIERLEANNISTGEISGRDLCYREGQIRKRSGRDRRQTVDKFNGGDIDVLLYNSAGATGGSYHAGATFADKRPRTLIEFETPVDIIKYVQAQGRGNRYDQVASPKVLSIMTGLTPEMRILQQRNGKLRSLGASVDGNRAHPLLLDDMPDLLNKVGNEATNNVLLSSPDLARRLGFAGFGNEIVMDNDNDKGSGSSKPIIDSLANKVLARSIMLPAREQEDLVQRIRMEFDVLIEELDSRNANPLRPKEFGGSVDIKTTTIFSGQEIDDSDTSVFLSPVYISTGEHDLADDPLTVEQMTGMVERAMTMHGSDGLKPYGDRIIQNLPGLLRPSLPAGYDMNQALINPAEIPGGFQKQHDKMTQLAWVLQNLRPGVSIELGYFNKSDELLNYFQYTVVDLIPPKDPDHYAIPSAYKFKIISPGDSKPAIMAVSRIVSNDLIQISGFQPGISDGFDENYLRDFSTRASIRRLMPVQILGGNILQAITTANQHNLGTISLYRDMNSQVHRGIVVHDRKMDLTMLPVPLVNATLAAEVATGFARKDKSDESRFMRIWGSMDAGSSDPGLRNLADIMITLTNRSVKIDMLLPRGPNRGFYLARPGLYEAVHNVPMPDNIVGRVSRRKYVSEFRIDTPEGQDRLYEIMSFLTNVPMVTDGLHRELVNTTIEELSKNTPRGLKNSKEKPGIEYSGEDIKTDKSKKTDEWIPDFEGVEF